LLGHGCRDVVALAGEQIAELPGADARRSLGTGEGRKEIQMTHPKIKLGIVGACGRGKSFRAACEALGTIEVRAVCDINAEALPAAAKLLRATEQYTDYDRMLAESKLDAVIIGTPMPLHVPQAIAALDRGLHVLSEVPAGVSVDECSQLVLACRRSKGVYMMAENYTYMRPNVLIRELVRLGLFGTPYYAEGEYLHEVKELNEITKWRRQWQTGINGITYGTHSLGPILQWMPGDRVVAVCCAGSGHHYRDPRGAIYENEDSVVMLCRMKSGGLVKIRVDMLSDRPHAMINYQLQGTDGSYESARSGGGQDRIWLRSRCRDVNEWLDLKVLEAEFLPTLWREATETARKDGHGGGDYFEVMEFVDAALGRRPPLIGIDEAMDMTLPGLVSQQSIREGGRWVEVPDSRNWTDEKSLPRAQLMMVWPNSRLGSPPEAVVPDGYRLRAFEPADEAGYLELIAKAGFAGWTPARLTEWIRKIIPHGFFVIEHIPTGRLVATAMATHHPRDGHPYGGELGWVAGDPEHAGKGLGLATCAAVTALYIRRGYRDIYLCTDDWRLPAIKTYLKLGYEPELYMPDMAERWRIVRETLSRKGAPQ
jgi:predicted dehydrogenase/GNAT superfamily N-acetyltransferase